MTLAYDIVVSGVITAISVLVYVISVELFAPGTTLHQTASAATHFQAADKADLWYKILSMYVPLGGLVVAAAWPVVRAYRRQAITARQQVR